MLLIHHARLKTWLPVGGEIEAGETPLAAARRELREETGLDGNFERVTGVTGTPRGLIAYEEHSAGSKGLHMNFCFVADVATDRVVANDEFTEHRWVSDTAGIDCPPNVRELVQMALTEGGVEAPSIVAPGAPTDAVPEGAAGSAVNAATPLTVLVRAWLTAFNSRELERLLALYSDDAVHYSPKLKVRHPETLGLVRGKPALRAWWADCFERLPGLHYAECSIATSVSAASRNADRSAFDGRVVLEYARTAPGEGALAVAEVFHVRAGRITESRVYHG